MEQSTLKELASVDSQIKIGDLVKIKNTFLMINTFFACNIHKTLPEGSVGVVIEIMDTKNEELNINFAEHTLYYVYTSRGLLDAFEFELEAL